MKFESYIAHRFLQLSLGLTFFIAGDLFATTLSGTISIDGERIPRIKVYASGVSKPVRTDRDGNYSFEVPSGTYVISPFPARRHIPSPLSRTVVVGNANISGVDFVLNKLSDKGAISGRVTEKGKPLSGVKIRGSSFTPVETDANGIFVINNLPTGRYYYYPMADAYTFGSALESKKIKAGKNQTSSFKGISKQSDDDYPTYFTGYWDADLAVSHSNCPTNYTELNGVGAIYQKKDKVKVRLPKLGSYKATIDGDSLSSDSGKYRLLCRVHQTVDMQFNSENSANLNGQLTFKCLAASPCTIDFQGSVARKW